MAANTITITSTTTPLAPTDTVVRGIAHYLTQFVQSLLRLDLLTLSHYFFGLSTALGAVGGFGYSTYRLVITFLSWVTSTVEVRDDDESYSCLMHWIGLHQDLIHTTSFVASIRRGGYTFDMHPSNGSGPVHKREDTEDDIALAAQNFEQYWAERIHRDKARPFAYTPSDGLKWFWYKRRFLTFDRRAFFISGQRCETIVLTCFGRDPAILRKLLLEAQKSQIEHGGQKIQIFRSGNPYGAREFEAKGRRVARPLSTVVFDDAQKQALVNDIKEYLHPMTRRWYSTRGIPYRRGYLLSGPPGSGKTSLCLAIAGFLKLSVYITSLNESSVSEKSLSNMFSELPTRSIMLLEDIDATGLSSKRGNKSSGNNVDSHFPNQGQRPKEPNQRGVSLSALLNAIDGIISSEGRILMMTTNHVEHLDPALIRPGRIDYIVHFQNITTELAEQMFRSFYTTQDLEISESQPIKDYVKRKLSSCDYPSSEQELARLAVSFASKIPSGEFSPAQLQGYLLMHKYRPDKAIDNVYSWIQYEREEKAKNEREKAKLQPTDIVSASAEYGKPGDGISTAVMTKTPRRSARARSKSVRARSVRAA